MSPISRIYFAPCSSEVREVVARRSAASIAGVSLAPVPTGPSLFLRALPEGERLRRWSDHPTRVIGMFCASKARAALQTVGCVRAVRTAGTDLLDLAGCPPVGR